MSGFNRFAGYGCNGGMPTFEKYTPAVSRTAKPVNRKPRRDDDDDDVINDVVIPAAKKTDPFAKMLDRQALAYQAQFGGSYEQAYTKIYCDPSNRSIVDAATSEHLAKAYDAMDGGQRSAANSGADVKKALDDLTMEAQARSRAEITGETFAKADSEIYCSPENIALRKAAPPDPPQDDVSPGPAHDRLGDLVITRMRNEPNLSHAQAFTREYTHPANRSLKERYDQESAVHARRLAAAKPFPSYGNPGDVAGGGRVGHTVGRSGAKPPGYAGG
jgi:hypothetical protein